MDDRGGVWPELKKKHPYLGLIFALSRTAATTLLHHRGILQIDDPSISHGDHHTRSKESTKKP
jgi:hypothetical protein